MKQIISLLMLITSISSTAIAQEEPSTSNTDKTFEVPADNFKKRFTIELGKGNKMQIELNQMADVRQFNHIDSILTIFFKDIEPLKDSLLDELSAKRIDYLLDVTDNKKIRLQFFKQKGASFLIQKGTLSALKLEQDTINFFGKILYNAKYPMRKPVAETRYYRISFFVNQISDLQQYIGKNLQEKIVAAGKGGNSDWTKVTDGRWHVTHNNQEIFAKYPGGYITNPNDYLMGRFSVNLQNYKNNFVPSFSLGLAIVLSRNNFKRDIGIAWEPNFFFAKNLQGKLQTYRNDFLTLSFGQGPIKDHDAKNESSFLTTLSLGYLITRQGDYFERKTFRLGAGSLSLFGGKTSIEPAMYFTDLFKGVTPGIRWIQRF